MQCLILVLLLFISACLSANITLRLDRTGYIKVYKDNRLYLVISKNHEKAIYKDKIDTMYWIEMNDEAKYYDERFINFDYSPPEFVPNIKTETATKQYIDPDFTTPSTLINSTPRPVTQAYSSTSERSTNQSILSILNETILTPCEQNDSFVIHHKDVVRVYPNFTITRT